MGACCSSDSRAERYMVEERHNEKENGAKKEDRHARHTDSNGALVRLYGSSRFISMFTQQGKKGINQDAMTVWEDFNGEKDTYFCAVFDGHGPSGHKVAQQVRNLLPAKLSSSIKQIQTNRSNVNSDVNEKNKDNAQIIDGEDVESSPFFSALKNTLIKSFEEVDEDICLDSTLETYCSGTTTVALLKQGDHLVIANLGDSRAVLCTRGDNNQLVSVQLTVDMKPNLPNEAERIRRCDGRVFAMEEEPQVFRIWMPEEDCPGLAMARAFGDFCLKDFGLISTPEVSYRKLTDRDEFVVLATDGVWDVLSNDEVIRIVASAKKRSIAARLLIDRATRAWRQKYPNSKVDDCAVICLFLTNRPLLTKSTSEASGLSMNYSELGAPDHSKIIKTDDGLDTVINCEVSAPPRAKLPRSFSQGLTRRRRAKDLKIV